MPGKSISRSVRCSLYAVELMRRRGEELPSMADAGACNRRSASDPSVERLPKSNPWLIAELQKLVSGAWFVAGGARSGCGPRCCIAPPVEAAPEVVAICNRACNSRAAVGIHLSIRLCLLGRLRRYTLVPAGLSFRLFRAEPAQTFANGQIHSGVSQEWNQAT